jgi:hypothetical protein
MSSSVKFQFAHCSTLYAPRIVEYPLIHSCNVSGAIRDLLMRNAFLSLLSIVGIVSTSTTKIPIMCVVMLSQHQVFHRHLLASKELCCFTTFYGLKRILKRRWQGDMVVQIKERSGLSLKGWTCMYSP